MVLPMLANPEPTLLKNSPREREALLRPILHPRRALVVALTPSLASDMLFLMRTCALAMSEVFTPISIDAARNCAKSIFLFFSIF